MGVVGWVDLKITDQDARAVSKRLWGDGRKKQVRLGHPETTTRHWQGGRERECDFNVRAGKAVSVRPLRLVPLKASSTATLSPPPRAW
jgi:hypothetical protein